MLWIFLVPLLVGIASNAIILRKSHSEGVQMRATVLGFLLVAGAIFPYFVPLPYSEWLNGFTDFVWAWTGGWVGGVSSSGVARSSAPHHHPSMKQIRWVSQVAITLWLVGFTINFTGTRLEEMRYLRIALWAILIAVVAAIALSYAAHSPIVLGLVSPLKSGSRGETTISY